MVNIYYDKKIKKWCGKCGDWKVPNERYRCIDCNRLMRKTPRSTNNGPNSGRRIRVDQTVARY